MRDVKVVYIMGAGRSGSTLLGIVLGNVEGAFYGGELFAWNHFRGTPISDDPELHEWWAGVTGRVPEEHRHFDQDFYRDLEHFRSLLRLRRQFDRSLGRRYREHNVSLFRAVRDASGGDVIVDSSHFPLRAWRLRRMAGLDVHVVHLVRDPRAVVRSFQKTVQRREPMNPLQANLYCLAVSALSRLVLLTYRRSRRTTVRYEDLVDRPDEVVRALAGALGGAEPPPDFSALDTGRIFQGNRIRHERVVAIRPGGDDNTALPARWHLATSVLQAPFLARFGYLRRV